MNPCKHCGCPNRPWAEVDTMDIDNLRDYRECQNCHARTPSYDNPDDAYRAWENGDTAPLARRVHHNN